MTNCTCLYSNYPGGYSMESRDPKCPVHGDKAVRAAFLEAAQDYATRALQRLIDDVRAVDNEKDSQQ